MGAVRVAVQVGLVFASYRRFNDLPGESYSVDFAAARALEDTMAGMAGSLGFGLSPKAEAFFDHFSSSISFISNGQGESIGFALSLELSGSTSFQSNAIVWTCVNLAGLNPMLFSDVSEGTVWGACRAVSTLLFGSTGPCTGASLESRAPACELTQPRSP